MRPYYYLGKGVGLTRLEMGFKMLVDTSDIGMSAHIVSDGFWAKHIDHFLSKKVKHGDSCLDLGCHMGYTSMLLYGLSQRPVVCYDMNEDMVNLTKRNFQLNGLAGSFIPAAIITASAEQVKGRIRYMLDPNNSGGAHVLGSIEESQATEKTTFLTGVIPAMGIMEVHKPDFVKIDLEGMDWYVADVMRPERMILEHRPKDALSHEGKAHVHDTLEACIDRMFELYSVEMIQGDGNGYPVTKEGIMGVDHLDLYLEVK